MTTITDVPPYVLADDVRAAVARPIDVWTLAARSEAAPIRDVLAREARRQELVGELAELEALAAGRPDDLVAAVLADDLGTRDLVTACVARVDAQRGANLAAGVVRAAIAAIPRIKDRDLTRLLLEHDRPLLERCVRDWRQDIPAAVDAFRILDPSPIALRNIDQWPQRPSEAGTGIGADLLDVLFDYPPREVRTRRTSLTPI